MLFQVNGSDISGLTYEPSRAPWGATGAKRRTISNRLRSLARSEITVMWEDAIGFDDWEALITFWKGLTTSGMTVSSVKVPNEDGGSLVSLWTVYTQTDARGISAERPVGEPIGQRYFNVSWMFKNVKAETD